MAITLVQTKASNVGSASSRTATWTSNTTTGNLIVLVTWTGFQAFSIVSSITDSQGNTYTKIDSGTRGNDDAEFWYSKNITGGTTPTVTVNYSGTQDCGFIVREYSGLDTSTPLDQHTMADNSTTTPSSGASGTTTQASELVVGWAISDNSSPSYTVGAGYGNLTTLSSVNGVAALEDKTVSSTGTQTATFGVGVAVNTRVGVATFKEAGGGGGPTPAQTLTTMGIGS